jgi:hypothetical protein
MPGGQLNLVTFGTSNLLIVGNPAKTFFQARYKKITNFGKQHLRIDRTQRNVVNFDTDSHIRFRIPRHAELLTELFLALDLPNIWSPPYYNADEDEWVEHGFAWIRELGTSIITNVEITGNGATLAQYDGEYISCMAHRDFSARRLELFDEMTGNVPELYSPDNVFNRVNVYPNAYFHTSANVRPSIYGRRLYIPLDAWFSKGPGCALPLAALQRTDVEVRITLRPAKEWYVLRDVTNKTARYPYVAPNSTVLAQQIHRFLSPPEDSLGNVAVAPNRWAADPHLIGTYIFLDDDEKAAVETAAQHDLLIKDVRTYDFLNATGSRALRLQPRGLVSNFMFRFRRSDVNRRNEWSNYTNWEYSNMPYNITNVDTADGRYKTPTPGGVIFTTGDFTASTEVANQRNILQSIGIVMDGTARENELDHGVYHLVEKYSRTKGCNKQGLYVYSFALDTDSYNYQPTGGMNLDAIDHVQFDIQTVEPPVDPSGAFAEICDDAGNVIGTRKSTFDMNQWNFDMRVFEERYNVLRIKSGLVSLAYAR